MTEEKKDPSTFEFVIGEEVASTAAVNKQKPTTAIPEEYKYVSQFSQVIPKIEPNNSSTEIAIEDPDSNSKDQRDRDEDIALSGFEEERYKMLLALGHVAGYQTKLLAKKSVTEKRSSSGDSSDLPQAKKIKIEREFSSVSSAMQQKTNNVAGQKTKVQQPDNIKIKPDPSPGMHLEPPVKPTNGTEQSSDSGNSLKSTKSKKKKKSKKQEKHECTSNNSKVPPRPPKPTAKSSTAADHSFSEYSQEAETVAVGIVPSNFPTKFLTKTQMNSIQEAIDFQVLNQKDKTFKPKFSGIEFKSDWLSLKCSNRATAEWLKMVVKDIIVCQEYKLKMVEGKELPEDQMIETTFPETAHMETSTILGFIESQNENLQTENWKLLRRQQKATSSIITFSVSQTVIKELKNCGYKIHFRYGTVVFNRRYIPLTDTQIDNPKTLPVQNQPNLPKPTAPKATENQSKALVVTQAEPAKVPKHHTTESQRRRKRRKIKAAMESMNKNPSPVPQKPKGDTLKEKVPSKSREPHSNSSRSPPVPPPSPPYISLPSSSRERSQFYSHGEMKNTHGDYSDDCDMWRRRRAINNSPSRAISRDSGSYGRSHHVENDYRRRDLPSERQESVPSSRTKRLRINPEIFNVYDRDRSRSPSPQEISFYRGFFPPPLL